MSATGRQLRAVFAYALGAGDVKQPATIWDKFKEYLCDDLSKQIERFHGVSVILEGAHLDYGLYLIKGSLGQDKDWKETELPNTAFDWAQIEGNRFIQAELDHDSTTEGHLRDESLPMLNLCHLAAYKQVTNTINNAPAHAYFYLQGFGGTRRPFCIRLSAITIARKGKSSSVLLLPASKLCCYRGARQPTGALAFLSG